jgi:hypothetical protein
VRRFRCLDGALDQADFHGRFLHPQTRQGLFHGRAIGRRRQCAQLELEAVDGQHRVEAGGLFDARIARGRTRARPLFAAGIVPRKEQDRAMPVHQQPRARLGPTGEVVEVGLLEERRADILYVFSRFHAAVENDDRVRKRLS